MGAKIIANQSIKVFRKLDTVEKADILSTKMKTINGNLCFTCKYIVMYEHDVRIVDTYICIFKNRIVKLTSSYSADTKETVKPVLDYVTSTLKISGN